MNKVTIHDWREGHIGQAAYVTDAYYLGVANKLATMITSFSSNEGLEKKLIKEWALSLAYYFEDVVSGIGMWQAFTEKHKALYGRFLPFYEMDDEAYYPDEVNQLDVAFILWLCLQKSKKNSVINPENPFLLALSIAMYEVLYEEFERAPINEALLDQLQFYTVENDFFLIKGLMMRLATQSYLFRPFIDGRREVIDKVIDAYLGESIERAPREYAFKTILTFHHTTGPLSLYIKDWLEVMLKQWEMEGVAAKVAAIEALPYGAFLLERYDADHLYVREVDGSQYKVLRGAFDGGCSDALLQKNKVLLSSLVKYDGEWMPNGLSVWYGTTQPFDELVKLRTKQVSEQGKGGCFRTPSKNKSMRFFKTAQDYLDWLKHDFGFSEYVDMPNGFLEMDGPAVYLCEEEGLLYVPGGARVIYDRDNPYYDKAFAQDNALGFLVSDEVTPKELLHYLVDNRMLPDAQMKHVLGPERGLELVQQNMDFLARCLRNDDY